MEADRIRRTFSDFFQQHDHRPIASASLVAPGDPTLLFTSAGMVPFKPFFLGQAAPPHPRLTSTQKCFRTTDIDEVGDESHLTFFEMMGNFSLGDYFKDDAQAWAWELITKVIGVPPDRLVATVFLDDDEAHANWRKLGVPEDRIFRYGEDQGNYWSAGVDGPCGPCSELHYDLRPTPNESHPGPAADEDRYLEIWNLVFMQFLQGADGSKTPLPKQNIDTGAGLERWAMMLQDKPNLYETDIFAPLLRYVAERSQRDYAAAAAAEQSALRVVVEHGRSMTFLVSDGVLPSNEGRGYVLRRLIRRALYMAHTLGIHEPLLVDVAAQVRDHMGDTYPEVRDQATLVDNVLSQEEQRFRRTLETGHTLLEEQTIPLKRVFATASQPFRERVATIGARPDALQTVVSDWRLALSNEFRNFGDLRNRALADLSRRLAVEPVDQLVAEASALAQDDIATLVARQQLATDTIAGEEAFVLYDTYGFPMELTREVAKTAGLGLDEAGFDTAMAEQRARAQAASDFKSDADDALFAAIGGRTQFLGYDAVEAESRVVALIAGGLRVDRAQADTEVEVILTRTPFYAEGGGQQGDAGSLILPDGEIHISDTQQRGDLHSHIGVVASGSVAVGDAVQARVALDRRHGLMRNHTATHLLHAALRSVLGDHVHQAGSLVAPERLRFDYTQPDAPAPGQLAAVQELIAARIRDDIPVGTNEMAYEQALETGAMAIFGEKYATDVRVVEICDPAPHVHDCFSKELCGGVHAPATGFIGDFQIISDGSVGAGVRRIEALTGAAAERWQRQRLDLLHSTATILKAPPEQVPERVAALQAELNDARRRLADAERQAGAASAGDLADNAVQIAGVTVAAGRIDVESADALREAGDALRKRMGSGVIVLATVTNGRPQFLSMITQDLIDQGLHAGALVKEVARIAGGGGGGRPNMAQAGGKDASKVDDALAAVPSIVERLVAEAAT
ncbi:MAG: alanyl-tRNA synthetase [Chloroflexi bacterium]|nr:MAG: alanyl-tRNA synthetase [Chloroflexota bacterium]